MDDNTSLLLYRLIVLMLAMLVSWLEVVISSNTVWTIWNAYVVIAIPQRRWVDSPHKVGMRGKLFLSTVCEGVFLKIKCYYSREFTSTQLSDDNVLKALPMKKDYCGQSMIKFFELSKIKELPPNKRDKIKNQYKDEVTISHNHNYGNCILFCRYKRKFNRNIYIPGVIWNGLCCTMPLMICRTRLPANFEEATVVNSFEKAYQDDSHSEKLVMLKRWSLFTSTRNKSI